MRLKEFIIFIAIFTVIYVLFFLIYDHFNNKKTIKKADEEKDNKFNIDAFNKFARFYNIQPTIKVELLKQIYNELGNKLTVQLSEYAPGYNITTNELAVALLFLEYKDLIPKRSISFTSSSTSQLSEKEETYVLKYSLLFFNKYGYKEILEKAGFGAEKEIEFITSKNLVPGVRIENSMILYEGENNE